ncbi:PREDICTED: chloride intracellular channel protein 6-like, partial [Fulmarus glacialis]|uniref:chloride intracellular channel protein 6-like n=1 Tax=Fulmarus glacialis TaxID=30455 RepID=UPI00051BDDFC
MMEVEDTNEESPQSDEGGEPDGAFLAEGTRTLDVQKAAEQVVREGQMVGERQALEKEDFVAEGGDARTEEVGEEMARAGDLLPKEDTVAVLQAEGQLVVEESAPGEGTMAEEDPEGKGTGKGMESAAEVAPGEVPTEGTESEAALGGQAPGGEEPAGAGALLGREADGAVSEGEEAAGEVSEGEEAAEEASEAKEAVGATGPPVREVVGETVSEAEEAVEEGGFAGKGVVAGAVSEGEEAVENAKLAEEGIAEAVGPEGEESVEEAVSAGEEAVEKPGALLETLGDTNVCAGEAMPGGEDFVKSKDAVEESVEPGKGPVLQVAPELEALVDAGGDPISEGSSQLEETTTAEEEEGSAEALPSGIPSVGSKAKTECAMDEKRDGGVMGVSVEIARAESGGGEVTDGAAGPRELAAGSEGSLECAEERGRERPPAEAVVEVAALPAPGL